MSSLWMGTPLTPVPAALHTARQLGFFTTINIVFQLFLQWSVWGWSVLCYCTYLGHLRHLCVPRMEGEGVGGGLIPCLPPSSVFPGIYTLCLCAMWLSERLEAGGMEKPAICTCDHSAVQCRGSFSLSGCGFISPE